MRDEALAAAGSVVRRIATLDPSPERPPGLAEGSAGLALVLASAARAGLGDGCEERAQAHLEAALEAVDPTRPGLLDGFLGVAWTLQHLYGPSEAVLEPLAAADVLAERMLTVDADNVELATGLCGVGVYLRERSAVPALSQLVARMTALARSGPEGTHWIRPPRGDSPHGALDLGIAHGVAGVIALAARLSADVPEAAGLSGDGARWLLAQEGSGPGLRFPAWIPLTDATPGAGTDAVGTGRSSSARARPGRLAWCYGDGAVALGIAEAGSAMGDARWTDAARRIARHAAGLSGPTLGLDDAGLCHGTCGVALLLGRIGRLTADPVLLDAARSQAAATLAGFDPSAPDPFPSARWIEGTLRREANPGFLTGAGGVALGLLTLAGALPADGERSWTRVLLLA